MSYAEQEALVPRLVDKVKQLEAENSKLLIYKTFHTKLKTMIKNSMEIHGPNDKITMFDFDRLIKNICPEIKDYNEK